MQYSLFAVIPASQSGRLGFRNRDKAEFQEFEPTALKPTLLVWHTPHRELLRLSNERCDLGSCRLLRPCDESMLLG